MSHYDESLPPPAQRFSGTRWSRGLASSALHPQPRGAPGGSIFVHGDPGDDEELRQFLRSVNPSYVEVAKDTGNALATLRSEGCRPSHDLAVMAAVTSSLSHDPLPTSVSPGRVAMAVPGHLADLSSLVAAVEGIPVQAAVQYGTELGGLDDLRLTVARDTDGLAVASAGVRRFGDAGLVMLVQTHPDHRRRGIAGALVAHAVRATGIQHAFLVATESGRGVYERIGFRTVRALHELQPPPTTA